MQLFILDFGLFEVYGDRRIIGIPGYLIRTGHGAIILVDTGLPPWYADDPIAHAETDGLDFGRFLTLTRENLPEAQLTRIGLTAADVTHLVISHSHIDHVGGIGNFPQATIVMGREERALPKPLYWGATSPIEWPEARYELIDEDTDLVPGVRILSTPGHTPGHLSLLVRLPRTGPMVLTVDALSRPEELDLDTFHAAWDERLVRESAKRLVRIAEDEHAQLVYGHSPTQWPVLKKAPEFYD